ncbi:MAG: hypothetical protein CMJ78_10050 [Planctomycetaceae bacterium]|nr:hypothetical protein [Planctomycetaceae bacterium]
MDARIRRVEFMRGCGVFVFIATGSIAVALMIDWLVNLPPWGRIGSLAVVTAIWLAAIARLMIAPLVRKRSASDLAAIVEAANPGLGEQLLSSVELSDPESPESHKGSAVMRKMLIEQTSKAVRRVDFSGAVPSQRTEKLCFLSVFSVVALLMPFLFAPNAYALLIERFASPFENLQSVGLMSIQVANGDRVVARGSDVAISATIDWRASVKERPENLRLHWSNADGDQETRLLEWNEAEEVYATTMSDVLSGFDYYVSSGRSHSREYQVNVVERPEVADASLEIEPPTYVGTAARTVDGIVGNIPVHEHSEMTFRVTFNKPIERAEIEWSDPVGAVEEEDAEPSEINWWFELSAEGLTGTLKATATRGGAFSIKVSDEHGLTNNDDTDRNLELIIDQQPQVRAWTEPAVREARPTDVVAVNVAASDDLGLGAVELIVEAQRNGETIVSEKSPSARLAADSREVEDVFRIDLAKLDVANKDLLVLQVRAADRCTIPNPHEAFSDRLMIKIRDDATAPGSTELSTEQRQVNEQLEQIEADLKRQRQLVERLKATAEEEDFDNRKLEQKQIADKIDELAQQLDQTPLFEELAVETRSLANEELKQSAEHTERAADATNETSRNEQLDEADRQLAEAEAGIAAIQQLYDELSDIERDLLELNRLAQRANQLADDAEAFEARNLEMAQRPDALTEAQQGQMADERDELFNQQRELSAELDELLEKRPELLDAARRAQLDQLGELANRANRLAQSQEQLAQLLEQEQRPDELRIEQPGNPGDTPPPAPPAENNPNTTNPPPTSNSTNPGQRPEQATLQNESQSPNPQPGNTPSPNNPTPPNNGNQPPQPQPNGDSPNQPSPNNPSPPNNGNPPPQPQPNGNSPSQPSTPSSPAAYPGTPPGQPMTNGDSSAQPSNNSSSPSSPSKPSGSPSTPSNPSSSPSSPSGSPSTPSNPNAIPRITQSSPGQSTPNSPTANNGVQPPQPQPPQPQSPSPASASPSSNSSLSQRAITSVGSPSSRSSSSPASNSQPSNSPAQQGTPSQQFLAAQAARMAVDVVRQDGAESAAAQQAIGFAQQAAEANELMMNGDVERAQSSAQQAAQAGQNLQQSLAANNSPLAEQAGQLAGQQQQLAGQMAQQANSEDARRALQQATQERLARSTQDLTQQLEGVANRLGADPLSLNDEQQQANSAAQSSGQSSQQMQSSGQQIEDGNLQQASQAGQDAARLLREAADQATGTAQSGPESPIPPPLGEQVADAAQQLRQAAQQLQQSGQQQQQDGQQQGDQSQNGNPSGQQNSQSQSSQQNSQQNSNSQGNSQSQGSQSSQSQSSSQSLRQAAEALSQAAQQMRGNRQSNSNQSSQTSQMASQSQGESAGGMEGTIDLKELLQNPSKYSQRDWGKLPGHLKTEIIQGARKKLNGDYAKLIKLYFQEIAQQPKK